MKARFIYPVLVVIFALLMRSGGILSKCIWTHDECVSYIAATGHQGEYVRMIQSKSPPYGVWTTCKQWKYYIQPDRLFCLATIRNDLIESDVHPPLYFWLLHLLCHGLGVHLWTGMALNIFIFCLSCLFFWKMVRWLLPDFGNSLFALALWTWSPAVIPISLEARPYELFMFFAIVFFGLIVAITHGGKRKAYTMIGLLIVTLLGSLTHYHFYIFACCGVGYLSYFYFVQRSKLPSFELIILGSAVLLGYFIHPGMLPAMKRLATELEFADGLWSRLDKIILAVTSFASKIHAVQYALSASIIIFLIATITRKQPTHYRLMKTPTPGTAMLFFALGFFLLVSALYLLGFSPPHAMSAKYLCPIWPVLAIYLSMFIDTHQNHFSTRAIFILLFVLAQSVFDMGRSYLWQQGHESPKSLYEEADGVVVDNVARGELLRLIWYVPEGKRLLGAFQADLLRNPEWHWSLSCKTLYISKRSYGNTLTGQRALLTYWPANCVLERQKGANYGLGELFFTADRKCK